MIRAGLGLTFLIGGGWLIYQTSLIDAATVDIELELSRACLGVLLIAASVILLISALKDAGRGGATDTGARPDMGGGGGGRGGGGGGSPSPGPAAPVCLAHRGQCMTGWNDEPETQGAARGPNRGTITAQPHPLPYRPAIPAADPAQPIHVPNWPEPARRSR